MAIDYDTLSSLSDTLKNVYGEGLHNQFDQEPMTYNQFPMCERKYSPKGNGYIFGIRYERAQGTGGRAESAKLPDPLTGKFDQGTISPRYIYGSIRLTGPAIEGAKSDVGAFVDALSDRIDDIYKSIVMDLNRQCHSDGFGLIATLSSSTTFLTASTWTATCSNDAGVMYAREGMICDVYNTAGSAIDTPAYAVARRISIVDLVNKTITFESDSGATYKTNHPNSTIAAYTPANSQTIPASALIVKMGCRDDAHATTDTPTDITGLDGIFDDGTLLASFEGITVASYPKWKANMLGNSSVNRDLSLDLMLQACDLSRFHAGGNRLQMRMGMGQRRKYAGLLMPDVRFQPGVFKGGYETLTFAAGDGTVEIIVDPFTRPNKIYIHPEGAIKKYELSSLEWGNVDQKMMQRAGYDEFDMFLRIYTNLGVEQRNALTCIKDLTEPNIWS